MKGLEQVTPKDNITICPKCGAVFPPHYNICPWDCTKLKHVYKECESCGATILDNRWKYCPICCQKLHVKTTLKE